ncbi:protein hinderin [Pelodytes ibericus]
MLLGKELLVTGVWMVSFICLLLLCLSASDEEQQMVYIPGLSKEDGLRSVPKHKNMKTEDTRPKIRTPANRMDLAQDQKEQQVDAEDAVLKRASLKDLCPEDKRRIANLIKELARVSEEKEVTEERLKSEHESFEKKIRQLEDQNSLIVTEREALQQQYRECQELLVLYQKYLSEQQEKLSLSLSDLSAGGRKSRQSAKDPQKPTSGELNGSYLSRSRQKPSSGSESSCTLAANHQCKSEPTSRTAFHCNANECCLENHLQRKCGSMVFPDIRFAQMPHVHQNHTCGSIVGQPLAHCCLHCTTNKGPGLLASYPLDYSVRLPSEPGPFVRHSPAPPTGNGLGIHPPESVPGRSLTEERKHELLLQKMELEIEKEQLQQLLVKQEEKLLAKQQQLQRSRWSPLLPDHRPLETGGNSHPSAHPATLTNGFHYSPGKTLSSCVSPPPSLSKKQGRSGGSDTGKKVVAYSGSEQDGTWIQAPNCSNKVSRKDAATSPTKTCKEPESLAPGTSQKVCRYETSLIDMLDAISPISTQRPPSHYRGLSISSPVPRSKSKPSRQPTVPNTKGQHPDDPEESRMLEDIFFIC